MENRKEQVGKTLKNAQLAIEEFPDISRPLSELAVETVKPVMPDGDQLGERHAVYSGTRNLYPDMVTAAKSLIKNSAVDTVWFLTEDDEFPYEIPPMVKVVNVKEACERIFEPDGPNMKTEFTHMAMIRAAYTEVLPVSVSKVLQLDVDTIVVDDIDDVWTVLDGKKGKWIAAVHETFGSIRTFGRVYLNAGFWLMDLDYMREQDICKTATAMLNTQKWPYIDQDVICKLAVDTDGYFLLDRCYNEGMVMGYTEHPKVVHYVGYKGWQTSMKTPRREYLGQYRDLPWEEVLRCNSEARSKLTR